MAETYVNEVYFEVTCSDEVPYVYCVDFVVPGGGSINLRLTPDEAKSLSDGLDKTRDLIAQIGNDTNEPSNANDSRRTEDRDEWRRADNTGDIRTGHHANNNG